MAIGDEGLGENHTIQSTISSRQLRWGVLHEWKPGRFISATMLVGDVTRLST